jgi:hypothetical protein
MLETWIQPIDGISDCRPQQQSVLWLPTQMTESPRPLSAMKLNSRESSRA